MSLDSRWLSVSVPWTQIGLGESPFVRVFQTVGIPAASHIMNFVVLTAALSSAVANLYFGARLLFRLDDDCRDA